MMSPDIGHQLDAMRKAMVIRNYAPKTVSVYLSVLQRYLSQLDKPLDSICPADIQAWQYHLVQDLKVSWTLFNQMVCALRCYFQHVRSCDWPVKHIPFQRRRPRLPVILSKEDVARLLAAASRNPKHHAILGAFRHKNGSSVGQYE